MHLSLVHRGALSSCSSTLLARTCLEVHCNLLRKGRMVKLIFHSAYMLITRSFLLINRFSCSRFNFKINNRRWFCRRRRMKSSFWSFEEIISENHHGYSQQHLHDTTSGTKLTRFLRKMGLAIILGIHRSATGESHRRDDVYHRESNHAADQTTNPKSKAPQCKRVCFRIPQMLIPSLSLSLSLDKYQSLPMLLSTHRVRFMPFMSVSMLGLSFDRIDLCFTARWIGRRIRFSHA